MGTSHLINYTVQRISAGLAKPFIIEHHYSHGCHNGPMTWGLFDNENLIGVIAFATPCSENVRKSVFGEWGKKGVTELHRLVILDVTPKNTESWFIAEALRQLKKERPYINAVISFADGTEGHRGVIYQASNFLFCGTTSPARFFLDPDGRLRHPRQNGTNISLQEAEVRGWTPVRRDSKYRYVKLLPDNKSHKKILMANFRLDIQEYPKGGPE